MLTLKSTNTPLINFFVINLLKLVMQFGLGKMLEKLEDVSVRTFPAVTFSNFVDYVVNQNSLGDITVGTLITFDKFIRNPKWRMSFC